MRRRQRRLRSWWRHEQQSIAPALATALHHSAQRPVPKKQEWEDAEYVASRGLKTDTRAQGRLRPVRLAQPHVVGRIQRHGGKPIEEHVPLVQILDALVSQMEDQVADNLNLEDDVLDVARLMDRPISEQVIEVPKFIIEDISTRTSVPETQMVEQLVDVPTVVSSSSLQQQTVEQLVDVAVPRGRGEGRVQGPLPRQSSTATPSAEERVSERIVEQFFPFFCETHF